MNFDDPPRITHVYHWSNNQVMVFDQYGKQMPAYQGNFQEVRGKINAVYHGLWIQGDYRSGTIWTVLPGEKLQAF